VKEFAERNIYIVKGKNLRNVQEPTRSNKKFERNPGRNKTSGKILGV